MARRKRKYKKRATASKVDVTIVALIAFSILLAVLIYTKSGVIGIKLNEVLGGMFGIIQYFLPIGIFCIGIKLAVEGKDIITSKLVQYAVLVASLSIVFSVFQISSGELQSNKELSEIVKDAYLLGSQSKGGGAIGAVAAIPLAKLLGDIGAVILCVGIAIVLIVFTFGINMSEIINSIIEAAEEKKEEMKREKIYQKEELQKRRASGEIVETPAQRRKRIRQERQALREQEKMEMQEKSPMENQIKINFGGRIVDGAEEKAGLRKYDHSEDNLEPLTKNSKMQKQEFKPDVIENNLFKDVEEQKEEKKRAVLQLEHAMTVEDEHYEYPPVEILSKPSKKALKGGAKVLTDTATRLQKTLYSFGVSAKVENVSVGPAITRYELKPAEGVRVSKIANLADDIALNLAAETIRIEAPIPGKQAVRNRSSKQGKRSSSFKRSSR